MAGCRACPGAVDRSGFEAHPNQTVERSRLCTTASYLRHYARGKFLLKLKFAFPRPIWRLRRTATVVRSVALLGLVLCLTDCSRARSAAHRPAITVLLGSVGASYQIDQRLAKHFTGRTGIDVRLLPSSESASRRLSQELTILRRTPDVVDVVQFDLIWPAILAEYLLDLKEPLQAELPAHLADMVDNVSVAGRTVGAPFFVDYGMLYYRTDLLDSYGFSGPPRTWTELEHMSKIIQRGERRKGNTNFWGYVWEGAEYEGLTCNALEWQFSQGGGNFLEQDRTVNVNNPATISAFDRANHWVGLISPPGIVAYLEEDARNVWQSGGAAFLRSWSYVYPLARESSPISGRFSVAPLPIGTNNHSSVLGGWYLGVSKHTRHEPEAIAFVKYMTGAEAQRQRAREGAFLPSIRALYSDPGLLRQSRLLASLSELKDAVIRRPATLAGKKYDEVTKVYARGVHDILTGRISPAGGTARMQQELMHVTGLPANRAVTLSRNKEGRR